MNNLTIIESLNLNIYDIAIIIIGIIIAAATIYAGIVSICLTIKYIKYNRKKNSTGLKGKEIARKILDEYGLGNKIKVKYSGSLIFGNSYSHYFKKVRLRRISFNKKSVSALAMASQKSTLAILDKENDPDMKKRIRLVPLITFGPFLFIPLVLVGVVIDLFVFNQGIGISSFIAVIVGFLFYFYSFVLSLKVLKTEKKAQQRSLEIVKQMDLATNEEIEDMKKLFELYNKEYVIDLILSFLEMLRYVLTLLSYRTNINTSNNK